MSTVFEMIIAREIPGTFVWEDEKCVGIMTIEPIAPGHALVIPREPISKWTDLSPDLLSHVALTAQKIGAAQEVAFGVPRATLIIAGFEVPHTHLHVVPARSESDVQLSHARADDPANIAEAAKRLRVALRGAGYGEFVPEG